MYETVRTVLGPKWALEILDLLQQGPYRYSALEDALDASSATMSERLDDLEDAGLIDRDEETIKNVRYSITPTGRDVLGLVEELHRLLNP